MTFLSPWRKAYVKHRLLSVRRASQSPSVVWRGDQFRYLIQNSSDYISVLDREGRRLYVSDSVERILGYTPEEFLGQSVFDFIAPEDIPHVRDTFIEASGRPGVNVAVEFRGLRADGTWIWLESIGNSMFNDPKVRGMVLNTRDITERKQAEADHQQLLTMQLEKLQQVNAMKDEFLSTVSHELRTPMSNIKMAAYLLELSTSQEARNKYLKILRDECAREMDLINNLLDLQRLESAHGHLKLQDIVVADWLKRTAERFRERCQGRQQLLHVQVSSEISSLTTDVAALERALVELLNNACKYTPPGGEIWVYAVLKEGDCEFAIANSGSEIPPEEQARIFEKFYRVPNADPWKQGGTGLGLALVKKLVEQLGGKIQVSSQDNSTLFRISLPITR